MRAHYQLQLLVIQPTISLHLKSLLIEIMHYMIELGLKHFVKNVSIWKQL